MSATDAKLCGCGVKRSGEDPRGRYLSMRIDGVPHRFSERGDGLSYEIAPLVLACRNCGAFYSAHLAGVTPEQG